MGVNHNPALLSLFWAVYRPVFARVKKSLTPGHMTYATLTSDTVIRTNDRATHKRRCLVLTDEGARHPFRAELPPHVRNDLLDIPAESLWRLTVDDVRGFASTYVATMAAVLVFIM